MSPVKSRPRPALVSIIISAIFLSSDEIVSILSSIRFNTKGPRIMPVKSIPIRLGSLNLLNAHPIAIPTRKISEILNNII